MWWYLFSRQLGSQWEFHIWYGSTIVELTAYTGFTLILEKPKSFRELCVKKFHYIRTITFVTTPPQMLISNFVSLALGLFIFVIAHCNLHQTLQKRTNFNFACIHFLRKKKYTAIRLSRLVNNGKSETLWAFSLI